ncbi:hypothetical protein Egran_02905 [Elaphomyces granulatus]|uniref:Ribosomal protein S15 n=1 Tax=Elaphomyces granulatus TaxID=519963 RepID=A0A232LYT6_9EURO|nr:hypothetical protein Egran_02905 [Elaphomyces granulatus]
MPPRILFQPSSLQSLPGFALRPSPFAALSVTPCQITLRTGSAEARERRRHDPFLVEQSRQRKAANLARRKVLEEERETALGDPVHSKHTPFVQSLEDLRTFAVADALNHFVSPQELHDALEYSQHVTTPFPNPSRDLVDPQLEKETEAKRFQEQENTREALQRIVQLANGNTQDRTRVGIQRCIETFGRHHTDTFLPSKPAAVIHESAPIHLPKTPRAGPDTGSSEVQVAILTMKILNLTQHLKTTNKDKHNQRNLQILVHKRQKLLRFLREQERGGPRWQHLMEKLGLSDAAWKGEISV